MSALWQPGINGHILSGCRTSLTKGRYRWRHDKVLRELAIIVDEERRRKRPKSTLGSMKMFVKEDEAVEIKKSATTSLLDKAKDREHKVDLDGRLVFPIVETTLRPDMVLVSNQSSNIIVVELTVP
ncbi:uncharacterized protein [Argopecten irradians]|uniref:uncharacterized protein n=1 Tax=Argopecten irradians TaxID=31199 RepID=UPI00371D4DFD